MADQQAAEQLTPEAQIGLKLLLIQATPVVHATPEARKAVGTPDWINRRVEQLEFLDTRAVRWRVSIDFVVPDAAPVVQAGEKLLRLVPVTRLAKTNLVAFSMCDERGSALWMPTSQETSRRMELALGYWASELLKPERLPKLLAKELERIVSAEPEDLRSKPPALLTAVALIDAEQSYYPAARERGRIEDELLGVRLLDFGRRRELRRQWARWFSASSRGWDSLRQARIDWDATEVSVRHPARRLMENDFFRSQVEELARSFVVHLGVEDQPGTRRIVKLTFEGQFRFTRPKDRLRRFLQSLGWRCWQVDVLIGGRGGSHHLEVAAPPGVDIVGISAEPLDPPERQFGDPDVFPASRWRRLFYWTPSTPYSVLGYLPHVHLSVPANGKRYRAAIFIRVSRPGWLTASWQVALVICGVLIAGIFNLPVLFSPTEHAAAEAGTAATLLLALLGVFATMLVRPGAHPLASRLLQLARSLILTDALAVLVGVGDLVLHRVTPPHLPKTLWTWLGAVAGAAAVLLTLSWLLPVKLPRRGNKQPLM